MQRKEFVGFKDLNLFLFRIEKFHSIDCLKTVNLAKNCPVSCGNPSRWFIFSPGVCCGECPWMRSPGRCQHCPPGWWWRASSWCCADCLAWAPAWHTHLWSIYYIYIYIIVYIFYIFSSRMFGRENKNLTCNIWYVI